MKSVRLFAIVLVLAACSSAPATRPNDREWTALMTEYQAIQQIRSAAPKATEKPTRREQIEVLLETHKKLEPFHVPFLQKLREYYERTGDERAAALYATEQIVMGDEYMDVLARYDRAINRYHSALALEPANALAKERLALAESRRFVVMDRFASVAQGMSEQQVRSILGQPREDWIKQVVQKGRIYSVWIYPKQDGGAAAVYFDSAVVYHTNWNAAPAKAEAK